MKSSIILFLYAAQTVLGAALNQRAACDADNCARAVTGTQAGPSQVTKARSDCSSFLRDTVTPAAVTSTATSTVTATSTSTVTVTGSSTSYSIIGTGTATPAYPNKRDATPAPVPAEDVEIAVRQVTVVPSSVPTYASACSGSVRYSSACSCWGITASTTTAATPTISTTVTVTSTTTVVATATAPGTIGVCAASDNYGLNYNGGYEMNQGGQTGLVIDEYTSGADTPLDCCSECYSTTGCFSYSWYGLPGCFLSVTSDGTSPSATPFCPNGDVFMITYSVNNSVGFGPCSYPVN